VLNSIWPCLGGGQGAQQQASVSNCCAMASSKFVLHQCCCTGATHDETRVKHVVAPTAQAHELSQVGDIPHSTGRHK
jgi:hypothetical protein